MKKLLALILAVLISAPAHAERTMFQTFSIAPGATWSSITHNGAPSTILGSASSGSISIGGGTAATAAGGGFLKLHGITNAALGQVELQAGNDVNSNMTIRVNNAAAQIRFSGSGGTQWYMTDSGVLQPNSTGTKDIGALTNAVQNTFTNGVQAATGQNLDLRSRNGSVDIYSIGSDATPVRVWRFLSTGVLTSDATNGGGITLAKTGANVTPVISGTSSLDTDLTNITSTHVNHVMIQDPSAVGDHLAAVAYGANALGVQIKGLKTRDATAGATTGNTIVADGDQLLTFSAYGADGTTFRVGGRINFEVDGTPGASDMPTRIVFTVAPNGTASPAEAFRISNDKAALFAGTVRSSATSDLGWAVVDGTDNTACNSQCTSAAVFGFNLAAGATAPVIVGPSDATADICLCAGAS
jgi:hypothetical protein